MVLESIPRLMRRVLMRCPAPWAPPPGVDPPTSLGHRITRYEAQGVADSTLLRRHIAQSSKLKAVGQQPLFQTPTSHFQLQGFTFVELLIAATMMAILFVGLATHLRGGIMVWQRVTETSERLQRRRVAVEQLERDLSNAFLYDDRDASYGTPPGTLPAPEFGADHLILFTIQPHTRMQSSVRVVRYTCEEQNGIQGLWRMSQSIREAWTSPAQPPQSPLLPDCESLTLQYAYLPSEELESVAWEDLTWSPQWLRDAKRKLPRFIEMTIRLKSDREIHRVFVVPVGVLEREAEEV